MGNITVAILGPVDYGSNLAKKGTSTDITLYLSLIHIYAADE